MYYTYQLSKCPKLIMATLNTKYLIQILIIIVKQVQGSFPSEMLHEDSTTNAKGQLPQQYFMAENYYCSFISFH